MKKVYLGLTAIAMQFSAMAATWTLNGTNYTVDVTTTKTLTTGVTYHAAHVYTSSHNMRIFYTITDLTNEDIAVRAVPGGSKLTNTATVSTMAGRITDATPIVGTNGGFFSSETPGGLTVVDGEVTFTEQLSVCCTGQGDIRSRCYLLFIKPLGQKMHKTWHAYF